MRISDWSSDVCSSDLASGLVAAYHHVVHGDLQVFDLAALAAGLAAGQHHFLDVLAFGGRLDQLRAGLVGLLGEVDVAELGLAGVAAAAATAAARVGAAPSKSVALVFAILLLLKGLAHPPVGHPGGCDWKSAGTG